MKVELSQPDLTSHKHNYTKAFAPEIVRELSRF